MMSKDIYITLDYELFLGDKTGAVKETLVDPTKLLLEVFDKYGVKVTFFVDSSYLFMLNQLKSKYSNLNNELSLIEQQLKEMSNNGHSIQLHIHPQWYYAKYNGEKWIFDNNYYKLSDMSIQEAQFYFEKSKEILEELIGKRVVAFRAGGYSIQSYKDYYNLLVNNKILIDSSVLTFDRMCSKFQYFDYSNAYANFYPYRFKDDILKKDIEGEILELPITTLKINCFFYIYIKLKQRSVLYDSFSKGESVNQNTSFCRKIIRNICRLIKHKVISASIDNINSSMLSLLFARFQKVDNNESFVIIGHPKCASIKSIENTETFIKQTFKYNQYKVIENILL